MGTFNVIWHFKCIYQSNLRINKSMNLLAYSVLRIEEFKKETYPGDH